MSVHLFGIDLDQQNLISSIHRSASYIVNVLIYYKHPMSGLATDATYTFLHATLGA